MDWDPDNDLLESFEPDYLEDKTFDINSRIFTRNDGLDLRTLNVRKRVAWELTGAKVMQRNSIKRLVGRVIVETDENRKVNEEEAKRIRLYLQGSRNSLTCEGELDWDSVADIFANTFDSTTSLGPVYEFVCTSFTRDNLN